MLTCPWLKSTQLFIVYAVIFQAKNNKPLKCKPSHPDVEQQADDSPVGYQRRAAVTDKGKGYANDGKNSTDHADVYTNLPE